MPVGAAVQASRDGDGAGTRFANAAAHGMVKPIARHRESARFVAPVPLNLA